MALADTSFTAEIFFFFSLKQDEMVAFENLDHLPQLGSSASKMTEILEVLKFHLLC